MAAESLNYANQYRSSKKEDRSADRTSAECFLWIASFAIRIRMDHGSSHNGCYCKGEEQPLRDHPHPTQLLGPDNVVAHELHHILGQRYKSPSDVCNEPQVGDGPRPAEFMGPILMPSDTDIFMRPMNYSMMPCNTHDNIPLCAGSLCGSQHLHSYIIPHTAEKCNTPELRSLKRHLYHYNPYLHDLI